ncbi:hypothetical protein AX16_008577 [Volvariella volvacea WC 439]|nr:hypothetical protein AX16_008577 [Volvariella volvacea WC 439]
MLPSPTRTTILPGHSHIIQAHRLHHNRILPCRRLIWTSAHVHDAKTGARARDGLADRAASGSSSVQDSEAQTSATRPAYQTASEKLFADALKEEAEESLAAQSPNSKLSSLVAQHQYPNWDGDERVEDTVLRMLVDKYKPLRSGHVQSAEKKLQGVSDKLVPAHDGGREEDDLRRMFEEVEREIRAEQPHSSGDALTDLSRIGVGGGVRIQTAQLQATATPTTGSWATEPLLPSKEGHRPWHTVFKVPTHSIASIKAANIPLSSPYAARPSAQPSPLDDKTRRQLAEQRKRVQKAGRLTRAKESTLDYKLGIRVGAGQEGQVMRPNPVSMKGWNSLIEEKIKKARQQGDFNSVKGRGQPITRVTEEFNPFIAREEFLMNRIVQRNGAAPPWVEVQGELESAATSFRQVLRQSWIRRAVRNLTSTTPRGLLQKYTLADIQGLRDLEWEKREQDYHDAAVEELNSLVRKYNGLAPYAVRRPYYMRKVEIERVYEECTEDILKGLTKVLSEEGFSSPIGTNSGYGDDEGGQGSAPGSGDNGRSEAKGIAPSWRLRDVIVSLLGRMTSGWKVR